MANRIEPFEVVIPAGTTQSAFQRTSLPIQDGRVDKIQIRIPPGPSGLVGFRVAHSQQAVIPYTGDRWFVTDDDKLDWDTFAYPEGDAWELWAYNTDVFAHTIYIWMHITDHGISPILTVQPVEIAPIALSELEPITEGVA